MTLPVRVDVRIIAATHQPVHAMVDAGRFRRDLYARLDGFTHRLWPLRDRREDVGLLVADLLRGAKAADVRFAADAAYALARHAFPQNVRELAHVLTRALTLAQGGEIALEHLGEALQAPPSAPPPPEALELTADDVALRAELEADLARHGGNVAALARERAKAPMQVYRWLKRVGIDPKTFRGE
jgi:DNA-binding NtrC family response regulator